MKMIKRELADNSGKNKRQAEIEMCNYIKQMFKKWKQR